MATTSIWRVKGWLGKVVIYAENPDKTTNPKFYTDRELTEQDGQQLTDVIRYAVNSEKTQEMSSEDGAPLHRFMSGINCSPATARDEMLAVKKRFGKEGGTVAYHGGHARTGARDRRKAGDPALGRPLSGDRRHPP